MIYWHLFLAFFIPGILGYGGGPASIPLVEHEVVGNYEWMTTQEFSEVVAIGNSLPGPIATKMAGYIGYTEAGVLGSIVAMFASVAPSLLLMIGMMAILLKYKDEPEVKNLTKIIRPVIAILLGFMTIQFGQESVEGIGPGYTLFLMVASFVLLEKVKLHPAFVIALALVFGAITGL
ncbi:chromate transporter [Paenisporosarcina quisquiliarum]|uniref:Chromate transporter n=1 Tax=Paenisporosarcina quisquiliarum TaxID=365346 RepID=A0A9X3LH74_9BACL|nr:chromate transporter [Paenisporosarcina quisquiliarum]MCZ8536946.1 chromate transporter [Paenisporosarcina quisquiliarum]